MTRVGAWAWVVGGVLFSACGGTVDLKSQGKGGGAGADQAGESGSNDPVSGSGGSSPHAGSSSAGSASLGGEPSAGSTSGGTTSGATGDGGDSAAGSDGDPDIVEDDGPSPDGVTRIVVNATGVGPIDVLLDGPMPLEAQDNVTFNDVAPGVYRVVAKPTLTFNYFVREMYESPPFASFRLQRGHFYIINAAYHFVLPSAKIWRARKEGGIWGASEKTLQVGSIEEKAHLAATASARGFTFDKSGNLWVLPNDEPRVTQVALNADDASFAATPPVSIVVPQANCSGLISDLAFDGDGNLWLAACGDRLLCLKRSSLVSGEREPDIVLTGDDAINRLAFDAAGNLWAGGTALLRWSADRLQASSPDGSDRALLVSSVNGDPLRPDALAFDRKGTLWAVDEAHNAVFKVTPALLNGSGAESVIAQRSFVVQGGVSAALAFDDLSTLWLGLGDSVIGSIDTYLRDNGGSSIKPTSSYATTPAANTSGPIVFFPAPPGLPLFHSLPGTIVEL